MQKVYTTEALADVLGLKAQTLRKYRADGVGPRWFEVTVGGPVRYRECDVEKWMAERVAAQRDGPRQAADEITQSVTSPCDE